MLVQRTLLEETNKQSLHLLTYFWHGDIIYLSLFHSFFDFLFLFFQVFRSLFWFKLCHELSDSSLQKCCLIFLLHIAPKLSKKNHFESSYYNQTIDIVICLIKCCFFCYVVKAQVYSSNDFYFKQCRAEMWYQ